MAGLVGAGSVIVSTQVVGSDTATSHYERIVAHVAERIVAHVARVTAELSASGPVPEPTDGAEYARIVAHVERVTAELSGSEQAPEPTDDAEYARIVGHVEEVTAELSSAELEAQASGRGLDAARGEPAPMPRMPRLKPIDRDPSDEVIALLKEASATGSDVASIPSAANAIEPAIPAQPHEAIPEPQKPHDPPEVAGAQPWASAPAAEPSGGASASDPSIDALRRELRARDALIANLLQRVEQLERRIVLTDAQLDQAVAGAAPRVGSSSVPTAGPSISPSPERQVAQAPPTDEQRAHEQPADQAAPAPQGAPGQFEVDEDAIDHALERTLVEQGVLLLPVGQVQIAPSFSYTREEADVPTFVTENGTTFVGEVQVRRNEFTSGQNLRIGLPFDAQAEIAVPYRYVDQSTVTKVGSSELRKSSSTGYGFGDISVGFAKTLLRENGGWWPDLVGRIRWDTDTGKSSDGDVPLGGGFNEIAGSLSAVKRQDPLAFVAGVSYEKAFEHNDVRPGDEFGFSIGTVLAASPETSLSLSFSQSFSNEVKIDGQKVDGSDQVNGVLSIGAASILGRGLFVNTSVDIGVTDDAPDYAVRVSVPIRFNLPGY